MDKLKDRWRNLSKKMREENKEIQKNIRKAMQGEPQAFAGQGRKLASDPEPPRAGPGSQPGAGPSRPAQPASAASNSAAAAALARFEAKNKPAPRRPAARPIVAPSSGPPTSPPRASSAQATAPQQQQQPAGGGGAGGSAVVGSGSRTVDVHRVLNTVPNDQLRDAAASLVADPKWPASGPVLLRVLGNISANPGEPKFRRLRLSNAKVQAAAVETEGALELLQGAGFDLIFEGQQQQDQQQQGGGGGGGEEEGWLVLPEGADLSPLRSAVDVLHRLLPGVPLPEPQGGAASRDTRVLLPSPTDAEVPEWFYEMTGPELRQLHSQAARRRVESEQLLTKAMREAVLAARAARVASAVSSALVRVRLPEGLLLQGRFHVREPLSAVMEWVGSCLERPDVAHELVGPDRKALAAGGGGKGEEGAAPATVGSADLAPSTLFNFRWADEARKAEVAERPTLRRELLDAATADDGLHNP